MKKEAAMQSKSRITRKRDPNGRVDTLRQTRASAGRSNGNRVGRVVGAVDHFGDVKRALSEWLRLHDPEFKAGTYHF